MKVPLWICSKIVCNILILWVWSQLVKVNTGHERSIMISLKCNEVRENFWWLPFFAWGVVFAVSGNSWAVIGFSILQMVRALMELKVSALAAATVPTHLISINRYKNKSISFDWTISHILYQLFFCVFFIRNRNREFCRLMQNSIKTNWIHTPNR